MANRRDPQTERKLRPLYGELTQADILNLGRYLDPYFDIFNC